jgi:hypothetical protein
VVCGCAVDVVGDVAMWSSFKDPMSRNGCISNVSALTVFNER